jgi:hypothetical protein
VKELLKLNYEEFIKEEKLFPCQVIFINVYKCIIIETIIIELNKTTIKIHPYNIKRSRLQPNLPTYFHFESKTFKDFIIINKPTIIINLLIFFIKEKLKLKVKKTIIK